MFPKRTARKKIHFQQGFLLPLALFILIVMGALTLVISRTSSQTQTAKVQEIMNVQAFYAAESGAQRGMQALFLTNTTRQSTDAACASMAINQSFTAVDGLKLCTVQVACVCRYRNDTACASGTGSNYSVTAADGVLKSFYTLTSVGTCGPQQYRSVRTIQVGAFLDQE